MFTNEIKLEFEMFKLQIKEKIMNLKHNQQNKYWELQGIVEDWFNDHMRVLTHKLD